MLAKLLEDFPEDKKIAIFMHTNPDPDSMGAGCGMQWLLATHFNIVSDIFYNGVIRDRQNQTINNVASLRLLPAEKFFENQEAYAKLVCVDCTEKNSGLGDVRADFIVDHHRVVIPEGQLSDIQNVGACCTIIWQYMGDYECFPSGEDSALIASVMAMGIRVDTNDLFSEAMTEKDLQAYTSLVSMADMTAMRAMINYSLPSCYYDKLSEAILQGEVVNTTYLAAVGILPEARREVLPRIADAIVRKEGVKTVVISAVVDEHLVVVVRSTDSALDVADFVKKICGDDHGGGKLGAGAAKVPLGFLGEGSDDTPELREQTASLVSAKIKARVMRFLEGNS